MTTENRLWIRRKDDEYQVCCHHSDNGLGTYHTDCPVDAADTAVLIIRNKNKLQISETTRKFIGRHATLEV